MLLHTPLAILVYPLPVSLIVPLFSPASSHGTAKTGHGADVKDTISGYNGHVPGIRDRIGGPGNQYFRADKPGGMSMPQSSWRKGRARTEFRDATRLYDKPWLKNAGSPGGKTSLETAWRPDPAVSPLKGGKSVSLAMGPKTERSPWTHQKFPNEYVCIRPRWPGRCYLATAAPAGPRLAPNPSLQWLIPTRVSLVVLASLPPSSGTCLGRGPPRLGPVPTPPA